MHEQKSREDNVKVENILILKSTSVEKKDLLITLERFPAVLHRFVT